MYLYAFRVGKNSNGHVLTTQEVDKDTNSLLSKFGFVPVYVDPFNKNERGARKICVQYENSSLPVAAFKVITPPGNNLEWTDPNSKLKHYKSACYVGLFGLPVPRYLDEQLSNVTNAFRELRDNKYHSDLENITFEEGAFSMEPYHKRFPEKNFFVFSVGRERDGSVLKTGILDEVTALMLKNFGLAKWYVDPANKTEGRITKVHTQFQLLGSGVSVFKFLTLDGNKIDYDNGNGRRFRCACYLGLLNLDSLNYYNEKGRFDKLPKEDKEKVRDLISRHNSGELVGTFEHLRHRYHRGLEDIVKNKIG